MATLNRDGAPTRALLTLALVLLLPGGVGCGGRDPADPAYVTEIDAWHAGRVARLTDETGWLTLVGLHPLREGDTVVGSGAGADVRLVAKAPERLGRISVRPDGSVDFRAESGAGVMSFAAGGYGPVDSLALATDATGEATVLATGSLLMHVIDRGGQLFLRVKDREADALRTFSGIERFPVDPRWRVVARIEPGPATVPVPNVLGQVTDEPSPGTLVFTLAGRACRLTPTGDPAEGLFIVFGDATNGPQTYAGGRFLSTGPAAADGTVVLDFNKAVNPPCAFSDYATCPLPAPGNTLPVDVRAGEMRWGPGH